MYIIAEYSIALCFGNSCAPLVSNDAQNDHLRLCRVSLSHSLSLKILPRESQTEDQDQIVSLVTGYIHFGH